MTAPTPSTPSVRGSTDSLHADRRITPLDREELACVLRYLCQPTVAAERLRALGDGQFALTLGAPFKNGPTEVQLWALDLVSRLSAQVPCRGAAA